MRIEVDVELCTGHGRCYSLAPEVYEADDEGYCATRQLDVPPGTSYMTMTSCSPMFSLAERIVAFSVFESVTPRSAGEPASLTQAVA